MLRHRSLFLVQVCLRLRGIAALVQASKSCEAAGNVSTCFSPEGVDARSLLQVRAEMMSETARPCTLEEAAELFRIHNAYRCLHGSPPMVWSDAVAENAYNYIRNQTFMHHADSYHIAPPAGPAGENLYWTTPDSRAIARIVMLWYAEVNFCVGGPEGFVDGCYNQSNGTTYHFTTMIWRSTQSFGCAWSDNEQVFICRYKGPDELGLDTPNVGEMRNYQSHVFRRHRTASRCNATDIEIPAYEDVDRSVYARNQRFKECRCIINGNAGPWEPPPCECPGYLEVRQPCTCEGSAPCNCTGSEEVFLESSRLAAAAY